MNLETVINSFGATLPGLRLSEHRDGLRRVDYGNSEAVMEQVWRCTVEAVIV